MIDIITGPHGLIWFLSTGGLLAWIVFLATVGAFIWLCGLRSQTKRDLERLKRLKVLVEKERA